MRKVKMLTWAAALWSCLSVAQAAPGSDVVLVSGMGAKCLDVEGEQIRQGTRIIGYQCKGSANQRFSFTGTGEIKIGGLCVDAKGGAGKEGDELVLWACNGQANQRWQLEGQHLTGVNGKCIDLEGGEGHWFGNQRAILWRCNGQKNQAW